MHTEVWAIAPFEASYQVQLEHFRQFRLDRAQAGLREVHKRAMTWNFHARANIARHPDAARRRPGLAFLPFTVYCRAHAARRPAPAYE